MNTPRCVVFSDPRETMLRQQTPEGGGDGQRAGGANPKSPRRKALPRAFQDDVEAMLRRLAFTTEMTLDERGVIWGMRDRLILIPEALPLVVRCITWGDGDMVTEFYELLRNWKPCAPREALELLTTLAKDTDPELAKSAAGAAEQVRSQILE